MAARQRAILIEDKENIPLHEHNKPISKLLIKNPQIAPLLDGTKTQLIINSKDYCEVKEEVDANLTAKLQTIHADELMKALDNRINERIKENDEKWEKRLKENDKNWKKQLSEALKENDEKWEMRLKENDENWKKRLSEVLKENEKTLSTIKEATKKRDFQYMELAHDESVLLAKKLKFLGTPTFP